MNCVGGNGKDGTLWKVVIAERDARAGRDDAGEAKGGGRVYAQGFGYHAVEAKDKSLAGGRVISTVGRVGERGTH